VGIHRPIARFYREAQREHHRYRSWEHCYRYFRQTGPARLSADIDRAALQLAFYLASWGMYRGSSFLLQRTHTVHYKVIKLLADRRFAELWRTEFGGREEDRERIPLILDLVKAIKVAYRPSVPRTGPGQPTDILVTKIILGTLGCLPACDRYFIAGFRGYGQYSRLNDSFIASVLAFCQDHLQELRREQTDIKQKGGLQYPLMKLVDMYFWQLGNEADPRAERG